MIVTAYHMSSIYRREKKLIKRVSNYTMCSVDHKFISVKTLYGSNKCFMCKLSVSRMASNKKKNMGAARQDNGNKMFYGNAALDGTKWNIQNRIDYRVPTIQGVVMMKALMHICTWNATQQLHFYISTILCTCSLHTIQIPSLLFFAGFCSFPANGWCAFIRNKLMMPFIFERFDVLRSKRIQFRCWRGYSFARVGDVYTLRIAITMSFASRAMRHLQFRLFHQYFRSISITIFLFPISDKNHQQWFRLNYAYYCNSEILHEYRIFSLPYLLAPFGFLCDCENSRYSIMTSNQ